jgi:hypothetical protein
MATPREKNESVLVKQLVLSGVAQVVKVFNT